MISEETALRIAVALERLAAAMEMWPRLPSSPSAPTIDPGFHAYDPDRCGLCGGDHGGMLCPRFAPKAVS